MKSTIRISSLFFMVLAVGLISFACASTPQKDSNDNVWSLLAKGDERAKGYFLGEVDVHETDASGRTPLHYAAERNDPALAAFFIAMGAELDAQDESGLTPLGICASAGSGQTAKILAAAGADIHKPVKHGNSVAEAALLDNNFLPEILTPVSLESANESGKTILHIAAESGKTEATRIILAAIDAAGANRALPAAGSGMLDKKDLSGNSALDYALARPDSRDHMETAEQLILAGAVSLNPIHYYFAPAARSANYDLRRTNGLASLHYAAAEGHEGLISFLIEKNANVNIKNSSGATPLHEAVRTGKIDVIRYLIKKGADVNAQDAKGNSVLHIAAPVQNHPEILKLFLENGVNPNLRDEYGDSPLHVLVSLNRSPETVKVVLDGGDVDISARNITGQTPLYLAVLENRLELIPLLLSQGSDIFAADNSGVTPFDYAMMLKGPILDVLISPETTQQKDSEGNTILHIAVKDKGDAAIIGKIIDQKANINFRNREGDTALHIATRSNQKEAGEYIISRGANIFYSNSAGESPLYTALTHPSGVLQWMFTPQTILAHDGLGNTMLHYASLWKMDIHIPFIIEKGVSTEAANATGETPLFWAVKYDGASTVRTLLGENANLHARDSLGNSALHAAVHWNAKNAVTALLNAGIDANVHSLDMTTPLHESVRLGLTEIAVVLINRGADVEVRDSGGNTPFMESVKAGYVETAELLAGLGANVMTRNANGDTPLHAAIERKDSSIINSLLSKGVSIHARNTLNLTPFQIALRFSPDMVSALLTADRINNCDDFGNSPLHIALQERAAASTLRVIIEKGTLLSAVDSNGRIPLRLAADMNEWELVKVLADAGSDPFSTAVDNKTSGEIVIAKGGDAIRAVFSGRAINAQDGYGNTILHYAARMGKPEAISLLLELGAVKGALNISAESPADIAMRWNNRDNAALLN